MPIADAGTGSTYLVTSTITLDASRSMSPSGQIVSYHWRVYLAPGLSQSAIADANAATTTFVLDAKGTYVFDVTVTDDAGATDTSSVTFVAQGPAIVVDAGTPQSVAWRASVQLSGTYQIEAGFSGTPMWSFVSRPAHSSATLAGASTLTPTFVADTEGSYVVRLTIQTSYGSASADVAVTATAQREILGYVIRDVEYSTQLDRFIIVSDGPPALRIHDPATGTETVVPLSATPNAVSIEPTGLRAVVGHSSLVTLVDLQTAAVVATYAPPIDVYDLAFGADGRVHCIARTAFAGQEAHMYTVTLADGTIVLASPWVWPATHPRMHPDGKRMYIAGGTWAERWDVSATPIANTSNGSPGPEGDLWYLHGGTLVAADYGIFALTDSTVGDMQQVATLQTPPIASATGIDSYWVQESPTGSEIAAAMSSELSAGFGDYTSIIATYDDQTFALGDTIVVPDTPFNGATYKNRARQVAYSADGSHMWLVADATTTSGSTITNAFAVIYPIPR